MAIWIWLLDHAVWKDTEHDVRGRIITVPRGSVCVSTRRLAEELGVGHQVVRTFLEQLRVNHMINTDVTHGRTIISFCNWEKYQTPPNNANTAPNTPLTHSQHTKEQVNNSVTYVTGETADPERVMWESGKAFLVSSGVSKSQAGSLLGKWRKDNGAEAVISALGKAQREGAIEPVAFIEGCLKHSRQKAAKPQPGERREINGKVKEYDSFMGWVNVV